MMFQSTKDYIDRATDAVRQHVGKRITSLAENLFGEAARLDTRINTWADGMDRNREYLAALTQRVAKLENAAFADETKPGKPAYARPEPPLIPFGTRVKNKTTYGFLLQLRARHGITRHADTLERVRKIAYGTVIPRPALGPKTGMPMPATFKDELLVYVLCDNGTVRAAREWKLERLERNW
jgi:hypothetical protein